MLLRNRVRNLQINGHNTHIHNQRYINIGGALRSKILKIGKRADKTLCIAVLGLNYLKELDFSNIEFNFIIELDSEGEKRDF